MASEGGLWFWVRICLAGSREKGEWAVRWKVPGPEPKVECAVDANDGVVDVAAVASSLSCREL